jgi:murein peptide amidase A
VVLHAVAALVIGHSVLGQPIRAYEVGNPKSPEKVLVVGCIHGNEPAGIPVVSRLERTHPSFDLWVIPMVNPDGCSRGTRQNAHGVDLNRDFYERTQPETRAVVAFIRRIRPHISIWYHQHQDLVRAWGQSIPTARRYARLSGMRFRAIRWPNGSAANWQNHAFPGTSSFVVELPAGRLSAAAVARHVSAVLHIAK